MSAGQLEAFDVNDNAIESQIASLSDHAVLEMSGGVAKTLSVDKVARGFHLSNYAQIVFSAGSLIVGGRGDDSGPLTMFELHDFANVRLTGASARISATETGLVAFDSAFLQLNERHSAIKQLLNRFVTNGPWQEYRADDSPNRFRAAV
jgi:hypothetical protein